LKQECEFAAEIFKEFSPRSFERGPIEAESGALDANELIGSPRSFERGPIEAQHGVRLRVIDLPGSPRSFERGPIEANLVCCPAARATQRAPRSK